MAQDRGRNRSALALAVAAQIRAERAASGLTQREVMDLSGIPKSTYLRLESGERVADVTQLAAFCQAVGVSLGDLMHRAEERVAANPGPRIDVDKILRDAPHLAKVREEGQRLMGGKANNGTA